MFHVPTALDVETACRAVLFGLGQALLVGSVLAVLTWTLVRLFQKRLSPATEMVLWCIVLLRFVIPGGPGWPGSLADLCARIIPAPSHAATATETWLEPVLPGGSPTADADVPAVSAASAFGPGWATLSMATYAVALLGLGALRIGSYRRLRAAYVALPEADADTQRIVRDVCHRAGLRRMPLIRIGDDGRAPCVMGVFHPLLVLSHRQLVRPDELETVIVHEVTHLRRGDMLVRCVQCVAGLLFFFWPVVAWVNRRVDRAREYACDEWALRRGKLSPGQYARCLFEAARLRRPARWTYAPACMAGHPSTIERRIDVILTLPNRSPRGVLGRLGVAGLLIAWCGFSLTGAQEPAKGSKAKYEPTEAGMRQHADVLFARVAELPGGDINGDGQVVKEECWAYVTAVVLSQPDAILKAYPWTDQDHDGQLDFEEAFYFARGDYDFKELQERFAHDMKLAEKNGDEQKVVVIKKEMGTAEYATWHEILDRRAQLIASAKTLPSPEFVRKVYDDQGKMILAEGEFELCVKKLKEVAKLKEEARLLRTKAVNASPEGRAELEAKAAQLEAEAAAMASKLRADIHTRLEALAARGSTSEVERYEGLLKKLGTL